MARKTKYDPKTFPQLAGKFASQGLSDKQIAKNLGISTFSYYAYLKKYPKFAQALKKGKAPVDLEVENAVYKASCGYFVDETTSEIRVDPQGVEKTYNKIKKQKWVPPNMTAAIFWLSNRDRDRWEARVTQDVNLTADVSVTFDKEDKDL